MNGLIELDVNPVHRRQYESHFHYDTLRLNYYPVRKIASVKINGQPLHPERYHADYELGLIYFHEHISGDVEIKYLSGVNDDVFQSRIAPLIRDMVAYTLTYNQLQLGDGVSSIKEGDVSVNYDTSNNRGNRINKRVEELRNHYSSARIKWL